MVDDEVVISNVHSSFVKSAVVFPENCWNCLAIMICISIGFKVYKHPQSESNLGLRFAEEHLQVCDQQEVHSSILGTVNASFLTLKSPWQLQSHVTKKPHKHANYVHQALL